MSQRAFIPLLVLFSTIAAWADQPRDYAATVAALKQRVADAKPNDRGKLLAELVRYEVELVNQQFDAGKDADAQATVTELKQYTSQCKDAALTTGKNLKQTELQLREAARRLEDVHRSLAFEQQPPVRAAIEAIQEVRAALLDRMFGIKEKQ